MHIYFWPDHFFLNGAKCIVLCIVGQYYHYHKTVPNNHHNFRRQKWPSDEKQRVCNQPRQFWSLSSSSLIPWHLIWSTLYFKLNSLAISPDSSGTLLFFWLHNKEWGQNYQVDFFKIDIIGIVFNEKLNLRKTDLLEKT